VILPCASLLTVLNKLRRMLPHMRLSVQAGSCVNMAESTCEVPRVFFVSKSFSWKGLAIDIRLGWKHPILSGFEMTSAVQRGGCR
jgi:hypothetical protein